MGTRLYPTTQKHDLLEVLAGVPAGTYVLLQAHEAEEKAAKDKACEGQPEDRHFAIRDAIDYEFYCKREGAIARLHAFLMDGWMKLHRPTYQVVKAYGHDEVCGGEENPERVKAILDAQGVVLPEGVAIEALEGVHWS